MSLALRQGIRSLVKAAKPSSPPAGMRALYPKSDGWYDLDSSGAETKFASGAPAPLVARLTANISNSQTNYITTGLTLNVEAGKVYILRAHGQYFTAATTTGIGFHLAGTATALGMTVTSITWGVTATTAFIIPISTINGTLPAKSTAVATALTGFPWFMEGLIRVNAAGTLDIQFASEVSSSAATVNANSYLRLEEVA